MPVRNLTHGTLEIDDGTTPTAKTLTIPIMDGDLEFTSKKAGNVISNRGVLKEIAAGEEEACQVKFTFSFEGYRGKTNSGVPSPIDALKQQGEASAWKSVATTGPYCVKLKFTLADPEGAANGGYNEVLTFAQFHLDTWTFKEGKDKDTVQCTGVDLEVQPTSVRTAS